MTVLSASGPLDCSAQARQLLTCSSYSSKFWPSIDREKLELILKIPNILKLIHYNGGQLNPFEA